MPTDDPPATPLTDDQLRAIADLATGLDGEGLPHVARGLRALLAEVASLRAEVARLEAENFRIKMNALTDRLTR